ncbi:MAG: DNA mismatch repair protein MutS [Rhizobiales bacterium]|nr:DNA mismatch repair protein MutS [Hyphomicrobiales bacterium]
MNQSEIGVSAGASAATPAGDAGPGRVTPMMEQYNEIRAANPDCLLFYRMGDFYELFFDDAVIASRALGITLTKRGKHQGEDIAMCGVPIHASDDYLQKLISLGHRVAVCEQTEDPAEARRRGAKSVVRRAVTRLITPGTLTEDRLLEPGRNNYLAALARIAGSVGKNGHAMAWVDISTGEFRIAECGPGGLSALLARIEPREVLAPDKLAQDADTQKSVVEAGAALTPLPAAFFDGASAEERLCGLFGVKTMEAFGTFSRAELSVGAALIAYVEKTQIARRPPIEPPRRLGDGEFMRIDGATRANLELFRTTSGDRAGSLLATIDRTRTAPGARLLAERLASPLCDPVLIDRRLDAVEFFVAEQDARSEIREALRRVPDMLRCLSRLALERGGPRDLEAIRAGMEGGEEIARIVQAHGEGASAMRRQAESLAQAPGHLARALRDALIDELPLLKRDGGFVRAGYSAELDEARALRDESRRVVASLQARYAEATGVRTLKIRHNNVLGYFVEVTAGQAPALSNGALADNGRSGPDAASPFIHRQTLASAMRFSTAELGELEQRIASAADRALALELAIFEELAGQIAAEEAAIRDAARALAELDVAAALAELAATEGCVRPRIDASLAFEIECGRHPVVEAALKAAGASFVGNDCVLGHGGAALPSPALRERVALRLAGGSGEGEAHVVSAPGNTLDAEGRRHPSPSLSPQGGEEPVAPGRIWLVTGPNMAGKSTFLRQNALIAILAQIGSFVPAKRAHVGVVDAIFSRVGAADDLARGRSTFMVEMVETAAILHQAGPRALVILDEIGRGTATFDGLSIAWAAIEHLHDRNSCRALFATHYHELTALSAKLKRLANVTMKVKEWKGDIVFLHEIVPGAADRSYGIQVAKLAGLPKSVIARARQVLEALEKSDRSRPRAIIDDLPLFAVRPAEPAEAEPHPALAALDAISPDELSPREALESLYELKRLRRGEEQG